MRWKVDWRANIFTCLSPVSTVPFHGLARYVFAAKGVGLYKDQIIRVHRIRLLSLSFLVHVVTRHQGPQKQSARIVIFTQRRLCTATTTSMARSAADSNHPIKEHALADENGS
uniref:Uncharacterized protein n=1 Tax=Oryza nivara TaxID=4536 RepID=A0A0E0I413_ORYNI